MNSYDEARLALLAECAKDSNRVVLLRGRWGTGKSHLWNSARDESCFKHGNKTAAFASLFGARSITEVKIKLAQSVVLGEKKEKAGLMSALWATGKGFIEDSSKIEEAALLWLPVLLQDRYVVLDDLERKNAELALDAIAGLIDELAETYNCRFLLLMNTDQLDESTEWAVLHEKIVDAEVALVPAASDCVGIAVDTSDDPVFACFRESVIRLGLTNIRGIRRAWSHVGKVNESTTSSSADDINSWVPSVVLLTAMHFKLAEGLPTFDFLESYDPAADQGPNPNYQVWHALLRNLGIKAIDDFEVLFQQYLCHGHYQKSEIKAALEHKKNYFYAHGVSALIEELHTKKLWDIHATDSELMAMAERIAARHQYMSLRQLVIFSSLIAGIVNETFVANLIENWFRSASSDGRLDKEAGDVDKKIDNVDVHALIASKAREYLSGDGSIATLSAAILAQEMIAVSPEESYPDIFGRGSVDNYVQILTSGPPPLLQKTVVLHLFWARQEAPNFRIKHAYSRFMEAIKRIQDQEPNSKLSGILEREFASHMTLLRQRFA